MGRRHGFGAIGKLPSKRYQAGYVGPDTLRHVAPTTFDAREDAEARVARRRQEIRVPGTGTRSGRPRFPKSRFLRRPPGSAVSSISCFRSKPPRPGSRRVHPTSTPLLPARWPAEQMLLVTVHPWDIHGAARAGLSTAWINRAGGRPVLHKSGNHHNHLGVLNHVHANLRDADLNDGGICV